MRVTVKWTSPIRRAGRSALVESEKCLRFHSRTLRAFQRCNFVLVQIVPKLSHPRQNTDQKIRTALQSVRVRRWSGTFRCARSHGGRLRFLGRFRLCGFWDLRGLLTLGGLGRSGCLSPSSRTAISNMYNAACSYRMEENNMC